MVLKHQVQLTERNSARSVGCSVVYLHHKFIDVLAIAQDRAIDLSLEIEWPWYKTILLHSIYTANYVDSWYLLYPSYLVNQTESA